MNRPIKIAQDAFGASLLDRHLKGWANLIIERDDGYLEAENMGPYLYFAPYRKWPAAEKRAFKMARGRLLDVGCGAGRWCLEAQRRGRRATGIDNSPLAVRTCRLRGVKDARLLSLEQAAALKPLKFDSVVMMGNNLGLLGGRAAARKNLRRLDDLTTPEARIFGGTMDPYATTNPFHLAYQRRNRGRGRLGGQIRMRTRYKTMINPWFDYTFFSQSDLKGVLKGSGWFLEAVIPDRGPGYIAVLKKEAPASAQRRP
jgi:SAM-dependent methyltransferase